jgi:hypothetical protein
MKKTVIIALALASITAFAQTETATAPAASAPAAKPAVAKKKATTAKKGKAKKEEAKPAAEQAAPAPGASATPAPAAEKVAAADVQVTPAADATSTAKAAEAAAPAKKWGVNAQIYSTTDFTNTQNVQTLSTVGGSYKVLPKLTVKAAQTFETLTNGRTTSDETRELTKNSNFRTAYTEVGVSTSIGGVAGSDDIGLSMNLKLMGGDSEYTTTGGYASAYNFVETNVSTQWTLNPKWSIGGFGQWRAVDNRPKMNTVDAQRSAAGLEQYSHGANAFTQNYEVSQNSNRFLISPSLNYTVNDQWTVYHSVAWIGSFKDAEALRRNYERIYMETGVTWTPIKNLSWTVMVDQDKAVYASPSSGIDVTGYSLYKPTESANGPDSTLDAVAYETVLAYSF